MSIDAALIKLKPGDEKDLVHFLSAYATDQLLTQVLSYVASGDGAGQAEYIGHAQPGSSKASPVWLIRKLSYDSSNRVTDIQFAGGAATFVNIWNSRSGYTYS